MTDEEEPDDTPEYQHAKEEWTRFWKRIREAREAGREDDPLVEIQRLIEKFGIPVVVEAIDKYFENLPNNFERRWRNRRRERVRKEEEAQRKARNPYGAGRKAQRSDIVLFGVWLVVRRAMRLDGITAVDACKKLTRPPSRREASRWRGLFLYQDPQAGPYYVKTPGTLRDIYNDAVKRYRGGPEHLRRQWDAQLETVLGFDAAG
jgi:hypothetical protein